jgi:hypothetical protein
MQDKAEDGEFCASDTSQKNLTNGWHDKHFAIEAWRGCLECFEIVTAAPEFPLSPSRAFYIEKVLLAANLCAQAAGARRRMVLLNESRNSLQEPRDSSG